MSARQSTGFKWCKRWQSMSARQSTGFKWCKRWQSMSARQSSGFKWCKSWQSMSARQSSGFKWCKSRNQYSTPFRSPVSYLRAGWSVVPVPVEADFSPFQIYRPALGPNQPRIQYVLGSFSGVKRPVVITTHLHLVSRLSRIVCSSPLCLRGGNRDKCILYSS